MSQQETPGRVVELSLKPVANTKRITLHPQTVDAINAEMAAYEKREIQLLIEIANLHGTIAGMRVNCRAALAQCMHPGSIQATQLRRAIALADAKVPRTEHEPHD